MSSFCRPVQSKDLSSGRKPGLLGFACNKLANSALRHASSTRDLSLSEAELRDFGDELLPVHAGSIAVANLNVNRHSEQSSQLLGQTQFMNPIGQRISELLLESDHTQKSLAEAIGVRQSHMSEMISNKKDPAKLAVSPFMKMCVELSTTPEYLFYGKGEVMSDARSGAEAQLLTLFRMVSEEKKELLLDLLKTAAHSGNDAVA